MTSPNRFDPFKPPVGPTLSKLLAEINPGTVTNPVYQFLPQKRTRLPGDRYEVLCKPGETKPQAD